jgi:hypothetical protein
MAGELVKVRAKDKQGIYKPKELTKGQAELLASVISVPSMPVEHEREGEIRMLQLILIHFRLYAG